MRKFLPLLFLLCVVLPLFPAHADTWLDSLALAPDAESVDFGDHKIARLEDLYDFLEAHPRLERVDMFATPVGRSEIAELEKRFPKITFGWTIQFAEHTVRTDATAFSTLHTGGSPAHGDSSFSLLKYCTQLRALDIGHNHVSDLSFLYSLPELRVLIIACNQVRDISPIASLKHLEYLEMFTNWVEDLSPLAELPYLSHLNICHNNIKDYTPLYQLPLKRLWMYRSNGRAKTPPPGEDVMEPLRGALAGCVIDTRSQPSEGGWREGIWYETFYRYFRSGEYVPFPDSPEENQ